LRTLVLRRLLFVSRRCRRSSRRFYSEAFREILHFLCAHQRDLRALVLRRLLFVSRRCRRSSRRFVPSEKQRATFIFSARKI
jgi:hypothetical protein